MQKRLMEIVLYILDKVDDEILRGEGGADTLKALLSEAGFNRDDIVQALRFTLEHREENGGEFDLKDLSLSSATLSREAWDYLERLKAGGLISEEESGEVLHRAADLPLEDVDLEAIRFLAASIIFDRDGGQYGDDLDYTRIH